MQEFLHGAGNVMLYIIPAAGGLFAARKLIKIPDELFRKLLHFVLLGAYIPFLFAFETWWSAALLAIMLIVVFYPVLALAVRIPAFSSFVNERKRGEFKSSLVLALGVMAGSICLCWGWLGDRYLVLACVYAWGVGDAFAALIGKQFGKHKICLPFADSRKSIEGSLAMFVTSAVAVCIVMLCRGGMEVWECLIVACVAAITTTFVELCSKGGYDTVTCPVAAMIVILPLIHILGG